MPSRTRLFAKQRLTSALSLLVVLAAAVVVPSSFAVAQGDVVRISSQVTATDGSVYSVTNHLAGETVAAGHNRTRKEYLLAWTGAGDPAGQHPDFMAVIDATAGTPGYGKVVNTVTLDTTFGNEPHHMQFLWHRGQKIYAGGLVSDTIYIFDATKLPRLSLSGVVRPGDTPCGSAPDAFTVLSDGTAYGTAMGGPDVTGPCRYSNGEVRMGNGFAGSPGEIIRIGQDGKILSESPAAVRGGEDPVLCPNVPALSEPTCANPHGIQVREDLGRMVTTDFAEIRNLILTDPPNPPADPNLARDTVRIFDIADRNNPKLLTVSHLPVGPRNDELLSTREPRAVMEAAVTNRPWHKGAFASTAGGGVVYYTPDITAKNPKWREVFDDATAFKALFPNGTPTSDGDGGGWLQVSPDDRFLFHVVLTGGVKSPGERETGMLYVLDLQRLLSAGTHTRCNVDTLAEVTGGGNEPDCPTLVSVMPIHDETAGGVHWGALDNFQRGHDGRYQETSQIRRVATSNYFAALTGVDGNRQICMTNVSGSGKLSLDRSFVDEVTRRPCVDFNRTDWPHGRHGFASPHGVLFAVADADLR